MESLILNLVDASQLKALETFRVSFYFLKDAVANATAGDGLASLKLGGLIFSSARKSNKLELHIKTTVPIRANAVKLEEVLVDIDNFILVNY